MGMRIARLFTLEALKSISWKTIRAVLIVGISFIILYPILIKLSIAFKDKQDIYTPGVVWIPQHFTLDNFRYVGVVMQYFQALWGSFTLSIMVMILQTLSCALAGYGFAKLKFRGSGLLFAYVIFTIIVPPQTIMVPTYLTFKNFDLFGLYQLFTGKPGINLIDTYWPFILTSGTAMGLKTGLYIYIFRQFFRGLPKEMEEAALVDGAGLLKTFSMIMLPNAVPALVTVMLFSFVWQWNDTYYASLFFSSPELISYKISSVGAQAYNAIGRGGNNVDPNYVSMLVNTALLLAILPLVLLYLFVQKYFVESVERTGIVG